MCRPSIKLKNAGDGSWALIRAEQKPILWIVIVFPKTSINVGRFEKSKIWHSDTAGFVCSEFSDQ